MPLLRPVLLLLAVTSCTSLDGPEVDRASLGLLAGRFDSLAVRDAAGVSAAVDGEVGLTLEGSALMALSGGTRTSPLQAGIRADLGLGLTKEAAFLLALMGAEPRPPQQDSDNMIDARDGLLLSTLSAGPFVSYELVDGLRLNAGLAPALLYGSIDLSDSAGASITGSGWGGGTVGRVGLELVRRNRWGFGLEYQWIEGDLDLGGAGRSELDAWRAGLTVSIGL